MKTQVELYNILEIEFGSKIKEYRAKWDFSEKNRIVFDYPLHLNFELNFGCNFKCGMCLHSIPLQEWNYSVDPHKNINFDIYCNVIDEGLKYGLCSIELNGINEPILKKDISKYIQYAFDKGIPIISLHTNGSLLTKEISENIINAGLTVIIFSIDANSRKVYEKVRQNQNYEKVINSILEFIKIKNNMNRQFPLTKVSFVKNKINYKELPQFLDFWKDKVDFYSTSYFCNPFVEKYNYEEVEKKYRLDNNYKFQCKEPYTRLLIQNNGNVCPCCSFFAGEIVVGNIYKNTIYEIWNSDYMKSIRDKVYKKNIFSCKKCIKSMG